MNLLMTYFTSSVIAKPSWNSLEEQLDSFEKAFEYLEQEIDLSIELLKVELDINGNKLIRKMIFIRIRSLKQEETNSVDSDTDSEI